MTDPDLPALPEDVRALLDRARRIESAPAAAKQQVLARLEDCAGPLPGGPSGAPSAGSKGFAIRSSTGAVRRLAQLAASFAAGGIVGAVAMHRWDGQRASARYDIARPAATAANLAVPRSAIDGPVASVPSDSPASTPPHSGAAASSLAPAPPRQPEGSLVEERALLDSARSAIDREDGAAALAATARHERKYPSGVLVQEREAIAIRALAMLDRMREARARVERFRTRFPDSVLLPSLDWTIDDARERDKSPGPIPNESRDP